MQLIDNKNIHTLVVRNNILLNGYDTTKREQTKNKVEGVVKSHNTFLSFPNGNLLFRSPRPIINQPKFESMRNNQNNGNGTNKSNAIATKQLQHQNLELREQLAHAECLGEVFMHYVCHVGSEILFTPEQLGQLNLTYLTALHQIKKA